MLKKWFVKDYEKKLLKKYGKNKEGLANNIKLFGTWMIPNEMQRNYYVN